MSTQRDFDFILTDPAYNSQPVPVGMGDRLPPSTVPVLVSAQAQCKACGAKWRAHKSHRDDIPGMLIPRGFGYSVKCQRCGRLGDAIFEAAS
jgi:hypothetical protein